MMLETRAKQNKECHLTRNQSGVKTFFCCQGFPRETTATLASLCRVLNTNPKLAVDYKVLSSVTFALSFTSNCTLSSDFNKCVYSACYNS